MFQKICFIFRAIVQRIISCGCVIVPLHSRLSHSTHIYTSNGKIVFGYGFTSSTNTSFSAVSGGKMIIGNRVNVNRNCVFVCRDKIQIGDYCSFGPNVCIYDHDHIYGYEGIKSGYKCDEVIIEDHCWIGAGVIILRGSHIGEGCIIGAGSIIKDNIPSHSLVTMDRQLHIREIKNE